MSENPFAAFRSEASDSDPAARGDRRALSAPETEFVPPLLRPPPAARSVEKAR